MKFYFRYYTNFESPCFRVCVVLTDLLDPQGPLALWGAVVAQASRELLEIRYIPKPTYEI